jgi:hypothetical protein
MLTAMEFLIVGIIVPLYRMIPKQTAIAIDMGMSAIIVPRLQMKIRVIRMEMEGGMSATLTCFVEMYGPRNLLRELWIVAME